MYKINTFGYLIEFEMLHVKLTDDFFNKLKDKIMDERGIKNFGKQVLKLNENTFASEFSKNVYHNFSRILKVTEILKIPKEELYCNILGFYHWGSHRQQFTKITKELNLDESFVEGYALYFAEGDNGSCGKNRPRKFRFTNSEPAVINYIIKWIGNYFPNNDFYVSIINPKGNSINFEETKKLINHNKVKFEEEDYNKVVKYKIHLDNAIIIDLVLSIEEKIKELCSKDKKLAAAYIRGMMIGEGTAYFNKSRYVRIEMRNEKEIKYLHQLLTMLGFECTPTLRSNRHDMWSLYIGAKQLDKFAREIGFGVHQERQKILLQASQKVLRVNQYC